MTHKQAVSDWSQLIAAGLGDGLTRPLGLKLRAVLASVLAHYTLADLIHSLTAEQMPLCL